ncbi:MAG: thiamine ABC transporter substrate-binding protein [Chloroflexi bacterium]|nr:thiamine ABC transporter substrate-binding protein [Chloroflexota bacterium]
MFRKAGLWLTIAILAALFLAACGATPTAAPVPSAAAAQPTTAPVAPTAAPTAAPTKAPTTAPTTAPTAAPTILPTVAPATGGAPRELVVMSHDSWAASDDVVAAFEKANNVKLKILKSGDAGAALNKAILAKGSPLGDVFFGVDNTFLSRALKADIFEPYKPVAADKLPAAYVLDPKFNLTPTDYGDVCLNYDKAYFAKKNIPAPQSLDDLTKPAYKGMTVVENPATSSPGLAFLIATIGKYGADKYIDYWKALRANNVLVSEGWEDAYYAKSSWGGKGGDRPIVVSYATSPAAEVFFSDGKLKEPPTGNVLGESACFRQIEFVGVLKGAKNPDLARKFVDFMLSKAFQEDIPGQMFVYPVMADAKLPDFYSWAQKADKPAAVTADAIDANREKWISAWTDAVLR